MKQERVSLNLSPAGIAIDCMRGALAIMVLLAHSINTAQAGHPIGETNNSWVTFTLGYGGFWVQGFFVLSGFCIHQSLVKLHQQGNGWIGAYTWARISRLYPIFGISMVLAFIAWSTLGPLVPEQAEHAWLLWGGHLLMLQGITGSIHELKPAWSLTYEAVYYAAWPLLLLLGRWQVNRTALIGTVGSMLMAVAVGAVWKTAAGGRVDSVLVPLALIPAQFVVWIGGAVLASHWKWAVSKRIPGLGWISTLGLLVCYLMGAVLLRNHSHTWVSLLLEYASLPLWLGLLVSASHWQGAARWSRMAGVLGALSYPLYVLHHLVLDVLIRILPSLSQWGLEALLLFAIVLVIGLFVGVPLESSILRWRTKWLQARRTAPQAQASVQATAA